MEINQFWKINHYRFWPAFLLAATAAIILTALGSLGSEMITLTTSYPSPIGIYRSMITTGGTGGNPANTFLARDAGVVSIGTRMTSTDPNAKLMMGGNIDLDGYRVTHGAGPVNPGDLATKAYVDAATGPSNWACKVVSATEGLYTAMSVIVSCPDPKDKIISGGCVAAASGCGTSGGPISQGWRCPIFPGQGCLPMTAYANCCH